VGLLLAQIPLLFQTNLFGDARMHLEALRQLLHQEVRRPILILGETCLHHLVVGEVDQISREAPVPILRVFHEEICPGGVGGIATVMAALGCRPVLLTVLGQGGEGQLLRRLLDAEDLDCSYAVCDPRERPTVKMRLFGKSLEGSLQQMLRMDWGSLARQSQSQIQRELLRRALGCLEEGAVFLCAVDSPRFMSPEVVSEFVRSAKFRGAKVIVVAMPGVSWEIYRGADSLVADLPLVLETLGAETLPPSEVGVAIEPLIKSLEISQLVVTSGQECLLWFRAGAAPRILRGGWWEDFLGYDHRGTLLGVGAFVQSLGGDWELAWELLQVVRRVQTAAPNFLYHAQVAKVTREEVLRLLEMSQPAESTKILSLPELLQRVAELRKEGKQLVFAYGNFEVLRPGHVASLEWARKLGDILVVGIRGDRAIRSMKGWTTPHVPQSERAALVAALQCVDFVTVWEDLGFQALVEKLRPDVLVNGIEWPSEQVIGWQIVEQYGGQIVTVPIAVRTGRGQSPYPVMTPGIPQGGAREAEEPLFLRFPRAA
jgi:D-beta-D-heptose 7-phosphate kinase/D-beta-D-heptose 1-phosphate adenosyltransferase